MGSLLFCCLFPLVFEERPGVQDGRCCAGLQGRLCRVLVSEPSHPGSFLTEKGKKMPARNNFGDTAGLRLLRDSPVWSPRFKAKEPVLCSILLFLLMPTLWAIVTKYYILEVVSGRVFWPRRDTSAVWAETRGAVGLRSHLLGVNPE